MAYFLIALVLLQSCVIYQKSPTTINDASEYTGSIKLYTTDENVYELRWIILKDGNVLSVLNTEKVSLNKAEIKQIKTGSTKHQTINLDSALKHNGPLYVLTSNDKISTKYMRIMEADNGQLFGIKMFHEETSMIVIPKHKIEKIVLQDKDMSNATSIGIFAAIFVSIITFYLIGKDSVHIDL